MNLFLILAILSLANATFGLDLIQKINTIEADLQRFLAAKRDENVVNLDVYADQGKVEDPQNNDGSCDFQKTLCKYTATSSNERFEWNLYRSLTPTQNTGPLSDRKGSKIHYYLYTESSDPARPGDKATLRSPNIPSSSEPRCLSFWYNAFGRGMGRLEVKASGGHTATVLDSNGDKGMEWHNVKHTIPASSSFRLTFTSTRGPSFTSDMAIDDISITEGECQIDKPLELINGYPAALAEQRIEPQPIYGAAPVGCYKDSGRRALPEHTRMKFSKDDLTFLDRVIQCRDIVEAKGEEYEYFGVEYYGQECRYGKKSDSRTQPFKHGEADNCKMEMMGAEWSFYLYYVCPNGKKSCQVPKSELPPTKLEDIKGIARIGCLTDRGHRAFPQVVRMEHDRNPATFLNRIKQCRDIVKARDEGDYQFFGVEFYGRDCFFGKKSDPRTSPYKYWEADNCKEDMMGAEWSFYAYYLCPDGADTCTVPEAKAMPPPKAEDLKGIVPIGCLTDGGQRAFPSLLRMAHNRDSKTFSYRVRECRDFVNKQEGDYEYFGVEFFGSDCWYGEKSDEKTQPYKYYPATNCQQDAMGAAWSFYLYYICPNQEETCKVPLGKAPPKSIDDIQGIKKVGCFKDSWRRAFPQHTRMIHNRGETSFPFRVAQCHSIVAAKIDAGEDIKYFGVEFYGSDCYYGKDSDSRTQPFRYGPANNCKNDMMGAEWSFYLYYVCPNGQNSCQVPPQKSK